MAIKKTPLMISSLFALLLGALIISYNHLGCLSFVPFGYNGSYIHLPKDSEFCVESGDGGIYYKTNEYGARIISGTHPDAKVRHLFGESQLLELDNNGKTPFHSLRKYYPSEELHIFAAPNSGPFETLEYIKAFKEENVTDSITVVFNFATDIFRILPYWDPEDFVLLSSDDLELVINAPIIYDFLLLSSIILDEHFTLSRPDNKKLREIFYHNDNDDSKIIEKSLRIYWEMLLKALPNTSIDFIFFPPYWGYQQFDEALIRDERVFNSYMKFACNFNDGIPSEKFRFFISSMPETIYKNEHLTEDQRHYKSGKLNILKKSSACNIN